MKAIYSIFLVVLLFACNGAKSDKIQVVTKAEMQELLQQDAIQLVDVRTVAEYSKGSLANAQNIDFLSKSFELDIQKLDKTKPVIIFCQRGGRSAKCAKKMEALGFTKIYDLDGGYSKWEASE